ncbi:hypothetical protein CORC01_04069 [Colletotrichum orchidophilum]|uniref:Uncharacterized protein n=1 Tax=Colletotrichum orchidophilum TaxID=1209926 RepID=A0A1G4BH69_9PEZI|nr:uncharacterized protein CORC01_04069 [Colletotrichum orchidophilum]OHF00752.1 hypothetical protein CORC01_04069 [Colletotrichum orchidophilum]
MHFFNPAIIASLFAAVALANPANLEVRNDWAKVVSFSDDLCTTGQSTFEVTGSGAYRCIPVTNKRSIKALEKRGCTIKTFSGSNCRGSHFTIPDGDLECHSVLHAAVEISC